MTRKERIADIVCFAIFLAIMYGWLHALITGLQVSKAAGQ